MPGDSQDLALGPPARPPRFSLIVATVERVAALDRLFASLAAQHERDFEVIVVDQNADERLAPLLARYAGTLDVRHLRAPRGLSRARNAGLAVARGAIVAFPDDDCRYARDTLARVAGFLVAHADVDGVTGRVHADPGERAPARFARRPHRLDRRSVYLGGMSCVVFLRAALCARVGGFDGELGLGARSPWAAAEETDYLARAVAQGAHLRYQPAIVVDHPGTRGALAAAHVAKGYAYARAFGFVMRRNGAPRTLWIALLARAVGGACIALAAGRGDLARYHAAVVRGRWRGWREGAGHAVDDASPATIVTARKSAG
jgi:glycosyltransferase involved in cell wall biosynthesis